ncbi:MAG: hypothetical protein ACI4DY_09635 [Monoglobaceae bacterium]
MTTYEAKEAYSMADEEAKKAFNRFVAYGNDCKKNSADKARKIAKKATASIIAISFFLGLLGIVMLHTVAFLIYFGIIGILCAILYYRCICDKLNKTEESIAGLRAIIWENNAYYSEYHNNDSKE